MADNSDHRKLTQKEVANKLLNEKQVFMNGPSYEPAPFQTDKIKVFNDESQFDMIKLVNYTKFTRKFNNVSDCAGHSNFEVITKDDRDL